MCHTRSGLKQGKNGIPGCQHRDLCQILNIPTLLGRVCERPPLTCFHSPPRAGGGAGNCLSGQKDLKSKDLGQKFKKNSEGSGWPLSAIPPPGKPASPRGGVGGGSNPNRPVPALFSSEPPISWAPRCSKCLRVASTSYHCLRCGCKTSKPQKCPKPAKCA